MSGISSGVGLISGIDTASLIDQLIDIERQPVRTLQARLSTIDIQRAAFLELSAQLLAVQNSAANFGRLSFFRQFGSSSSDESALVADASDKAVPGTHTFRVRSLVSNHALISRGFADADTTPIGVGHLTIESAAAGVNRSTDLDTLNGGTGVRRGSITITDRSGATAEIDLSTAVTMNDVLEAINSNSAINVRASVTGLAGAGGASGDRLVLVDETPLDEIVGRGVFSVTNAGDGFAATDLGIAFEVEDSSGTSLRFDGRDLVRLSNQTPLSLLNDGNGVGRLRSGNDILFTTDEGSFDVSLSNLLPARLDTDLRILNSGNGVRLGVVRITDRNGQSADIDLTNARTVKDVLDRMNGAGISIRAAVVGVDNTSVFQVTDTSDVGDAIPDDPNPPKLIIEDLSGHAAADLGIAIETTEGSVSSDGIYRIETIGDVINAINYAKGNNSLVEASISADGNGISIRALGVGNTVTVSCGVDRDSATGEVLGETASTAAFDLGLLGADGVRNYDTRHLIGGINTVLLQTLHGGRGVELGEVSLTDRAGNNTTIDFSSAHTLQDVIDLINLEGGTKLKASINAAGNGVLLEDHSNGEGGITIEDLTGSTAAGLGISGTFTDATTVAGANLNRQYVSRQTLLSSLNQGRGVAEGSFLVTDSTGSVKTFSIDDGQKTVGDLIDSLNAVAGDTLQFRINDGGDGIVLADSAGGSDSLKIEDIDGGKSAADLRLAGRAKRDENFIDGSHEIRVEINADDTLNDIATKINESGGAVSASVVNHGSALNPFSLTLTSKLTGRAGEMSIGGVGVDLGLSTLSRAQDAVISIGDDTAENPRLVTSSTNTIEGVVPGVTLNLLSVSDDPVTVTVSQDIGKVTDAISSFVESYNTVLDTIDDGTSFDQDTLERGPLLGDSAADRIRQRLVRLPLREFEGADSSLSRLFSVGLRLGSGNRLTFNEDEFLEAYQESPEAVETLFTADETGVAAVFGEALEDLTRDFDGVISRKNDLLTDQQDLLNGRIDSLNVLLDAKRARLEAQFIALESSLASLQGQQSALNALSQSG
jgi:flagellar hook-associated protein 2